MRFVVGTIILAVIGWIGYWFYASGLERDAIGQEIARLRDAGYEVGWEKSDFDGFPYRFDIHLTQPRLATPDGSWGWQGDEFYSVQLAYKPWHLILAWPGRHVFATPAGPFTIEGERIWGSLKFGRRMPPRLRSGRLEITHGRLALPSGDEIRAGKALVALAHPVASQAAAAGPGAAGAKAEDAPRDALAEKIATAAADADEDGYLRLVSLSLPEQLRARLALPPDLPPTIERIELDLSYGVAGEADRPLPIDPARPIAIRKAVIAWGDVRLEGRGVLRRNETGRLAGRFEIVTADLPALLDHLEKAGWIESRQAALIARLGEELARQQAAARAQAGERSHAGERKALRLPLSFEGGRMRLLGLPLGPAPAL